MIELQDEKRHNEVCTLMGGLFKTLCRVVGNEKVTLHNPGLGREISHPHWITVDSESGAVPAGCTGKIFLQYTPEEGLWSVIEMFFLEGHARPGRAPVSTRNFFEALHLLGHWSGVAHRLDEKMI